MSLFINTGIKACAFSSGKDYSTKKEVENNVEVISIYKKDNGTLVKVTSYPCSEIALSPRKKDIQKLCFEIWCKTSFYDFQLPTELPARKAIPKPKQSHRNEDKALSFLREQVRIKENLARISIKALVHPTNVPVAPVLPILVTPQMQYMIPNSMPNIIIPIAIYPVFIFNQIPS